MKKIYFFFTSLLPTGTVPVINFTTNSFQILKFMLQIMLGEVKKFNCMFRDTSVNYWLNMYVLYVLCTHAYVHYCITVTPI